jgi:hypothetical protein
MSSAPAVAVESKPTSLVIGAVPPDALIDRLGPFVD